MCLYINLLTIRLNVFANMMSIICIVNGLLKMFNIL